MTRSFLTLFRNAVDKGLLLIAATLLGFILPNSNFASLYDGILHTRLEVIFQEIKVGISAHAFVNDLLMAIFFLVVGIEIKKELISGHLASRSQRVLPVIAAMGGVIMPLIMYIFLNRNDSHDLIGWAIPTATDIAFVIAVMSMFSSKIPSSIKVFVTALAIIDDLIAVIIIALFYTENIQMDFLFLIVLCITALIFLNRKNVEELYIYVLIGIVMFFAFCFSGVHATIAGVVLGFCIPQNLGENLAKALQSSVTYFIMPVFAFFNSGITLSGFTTNNLFDPVILGIIFGLFIGKQVGIFGSCYLLVKSKLVSMPEKANFYDVYVAAVLCGIGFTMSLFVASLAFEQGSIQLLESKVGILIGSLLSFAYGALLLRFKKFT